MKSIFSVEASSRVHFALTLSKPVGLYIIKFTVGRAILGPPGLGVGGVPAPYIEDSWGPCVVAPRGPPLADAAAGAWPAAGGAAAGALPVWGPWTAWGAWVVSRVCSSDWEWVCCFFAESLELVSAKCILYNV